MATVIDSLIVTLGLDPTGIKKGADEAEQAQGKVTAAAHKSGKTIEEGEKKLADAQKARAKELQSHAKSMVDGLSKIRNEALALLGVFTAGMGIKRFTESTVTNAANLGFLADNLGMTTERLQAYMRAAERAGGTQEGMVAQLKESAEQIQSFRSGMVPEQMTWFFRLGGSSEALKDGNTYLMERARIVSEIFRQDPQKAMLMAKYIGISEDQFNLIKQGPDAIKALIDAQEKNSAVSREQAAAMLDLKNKWLDFADRINFTATTIMLKLAPAFDALLKYFNEWADSFAKWVVAHQKDFPKWVEEAIKAAKLFADKLDKAAESLGGWQKVLEALLAIKVFEMATGFNLLGASLATVGTALVAIAGAGPAVAATLGGLSGWGFGKWLLANLPENITDEMRENYAKLLDLVGESEYANEVRGRMSGNAKPNASPAPSEKKNPFKETFDAAEKKYNLPAGLLSKMGEVESGFNPDAVSPKGAKGVMQFMPATAARFGIAGKESDPAASIDAAGRYMRWLIDHFHGDVRKAVMAYNAGEGNIDKGIYPAETKDYVRKIFGSPPTNSQPTESKSEPGALDKMKKWLDERRQELERTRRHPGESEADWRKRTGKQEVGALWGGASANALALSGIPSGAYMRGMSGGSSIANDIHIGKIEIHTQATDADGIAQSIRPAIRNNPLVANSATGLS